MFIKKRQWLNENDFFEYFDQVIMENTEYWNIVSCIFGLLLGYLINFHINFNEIFSFLIDIYFFVF